MRNAIYDYTICRLSVLLFLDIPPFASLCTLPIRTRVVVAVAFQKVDNPPYAEASAERNNEGFEYIYRRIKKSHAIGKDQIFEKVSFVHLRTKQPTKQQIAKRTFCSFRASIWSFLS